MNVRPVAVADFRNVRRSRLLWGATILLAAFFALFLASQSGSGELAALMALDNFVRPVAFFVPLIVSTVGYLAIAGEHESGSIGFLLGLPNSRADVLLGKFLGRAAVAFAAVVSALAVGALVLFASYSSLPLAEFLAFSTMTAFLALVYVAIAVGISAVCTTRARAMAGTLGLYFLCTVGWVAPSINPVAGVTFAVEDVLGLEPLPNLYDFVFVLSPSFAYEQATDEFLSMQAIGPGGAASTGADPFFLQAEFMLVIMTLWIALPLSVGYLRFRTLEVN